jgi:hypothetical protein
MEELFVVVIGIVVVFVTVGATVWFIMEATAQGTR